MITKKNMEFLFSISFLLMILGICLSFLGFILIDNGEKFKGALCFLPAVIGFICYLIADKDKVEIYQREEQEKMKSQSYDR